jgi:hypothetical protein
MDRYFEWDEHKAESNYRNHGIRFEEAARVFDDPLAISRQDRIENGEERWQTIGLVAGCRLPAADGGAHAAPGRRGKRGGAHHQRPPRGPDRKEAL